LPHIRKDALAQTGELPVTIDAIGTKWVDKNVASIITGSSPVQARASFLI